MSVAKDALNLDHKKLPSKTKKLLHKIVQHFFRLYPPDAGRLTAAALGALEPSGMYASCLDCE
jgi:hypothetical protein